MQMHAANKQKIQTIYNLASIIRAHKSKKVNPHNFLFCFTQLAETREDAEEWMNLWQQMREDGVNAMQSVSAAFLKWFAERGEGEGCERVLENMHKDGYKRIPWCMPF